MASTVITSAAGRSARRSRVAAIISIFKLRIGSEITLTMVAGVAVTAGAGLEAWQLAALALAVLLSSASAGALNHYAERDLDVLMARTRSRPFATGELEPGARWIALVAGLLTGAVLLAAWATNAVAAAQVFLGAFTYGIVYTLWLKRRTWLNIVFGGFAGTFALLAGALAVDPQLQLEGAMLAIAMFFWTPPHFWSLALYNKRDYVGAGVPMLPAIASERTTSMVILAHTVLLVGFSLVPAFTGLGPVYAVCVAAGGGWFLYCSLRLALRPTRAAALANFRASLVQLSLLLVGAIADGVLQGRLLA